MLINGLELGPSCQKVNPDGFIGQASYRESSNKLDCELPQHETILDSGHPGEVYDPHPWERDYNNNGAGAPWERDYNNNDDLGLLPEERDYNNNGDP